MSVYILWISVSSNFKVYLPLQWEVGERFKRKETYVYLWLIYVDVWQKAAQYCKAIILQLQISKFLRKEKICQFS